jgi:uncharacterized protein YkwD
VSRTHPYLKERIGWKLNILLVFLLAGAGLLWTVRSGAAQQIGYTGCGGMSVGPLNLDYEQELVELVNIERRSRGLAPVKLVKELHTAARYHAADMALDDYFQHNTSDWLNGALTEVCQWSTRISSFYTGWERLGENLAAGTKTPTSTHTALMYSSGHRENILKPEFWELGVGYYRTGEGSTAYWVQDFGRTWNRYPLVINYEAARTISSEVELYIYGSEKWKEMRLRNDDGDWTAWKPFQSTLSWSLAKKPGLRTVTVEMRQGNERAISSDEISLVVALNDLPETLYFSYSRAGQEVLPAAFNLQPTLSYPAGDFSWQIQQQGSFFQAAPESGGKDATLAITPENLAAFPPGIYSGQVTVTVAAPQGVINSPIVMDIKLYVQEAAFERVYLPAVNTGR